MRLFTGFPLGAESSFPPPVTLLLPPVLVPPPPVSTGLDFASASVGSCEMEVLVLVVDSASVVFDFGDLLAVASAATILV